MAIQLGKNLFILIRDLPTGEYFPISCDRSCTVEVTRGIIDTVGPENGAFTTGVPAADITGVVSGDTLVDFSKKYSFAELLQILYDGTLVFLMWELEGVTFEAKGYFQSISITGQFRDALVYNYSIRLVGEHLFTNNSAKDPDQTGFTNLLIVEPAGELFDIDNSDNSLIL